MSTRTTKTSGAAWKTIHDEKAAIQAALDDAFARFHGYIHVSLSKRPGYSEFGKRRALEIRWIGQPTEAAITEVIDSLRDSRNRRVSSEIVLHRERMWSCGRTHVDAEEAWMEHEGHHHLTYDSARDESELDDETRAELAAQGETFESEWCTPGNHGRCPTCGGGGRVLVSKDPLTGFTGCPDCERLGLNRTVFPGVLNLDDPEQAEFYNAAFTAHIAARDATARREQKAKDKALAAETTWSTPNWVPLPTLNAGILAGRPVPPRFGCDYLTNADDPDRRVRCDNKAAWFDTNTGLRCCTKHKNAEPLPRPSEEA